MLGRWVDLRAIRIADTQSLDLPSMMPVDYRLMPTAREWRPSSEPIHALYRGWPLPSQRDRLDVFGAVHRVHVDNYHGELVNLHQLHMHESPFLGSIAREQFGGVVPQSGPKCVGPNG